MYGRMLHACLCMMNFFYHGSGTGPSLCAIFNNYSLAGVPTRGDDVCMALFRFGIVGGQAQYMAQAFYLSQDYIQHAKPRSSPFKLSSFIG